MNVVAALLYAWATSVLVAICLGFRDGALNADNAAVSLASGLLVGVVAWWAGRRTARPAPRPRGWEWFPVVLFALFAARSFLWLVYYDKDDLCVLSPNNQGDMSLHLTYINYFAKGAPLWPDNPIFSQGKLAYAAGTDLFNSLLVLVGVDVVRGLVWVGLIGAALSGAALWRWGRGFALLGFLCAGGLLGFAAFTQSAEQPFFQDYAGFLRFDWAWKSLPLALLVTQRGFLFALPAGLLLLSSWRTRYLGADEGWRLPRWGAWLLYGAMPIFHVHSFIALSFVLAALFLAHRPARWRVVGLAAAACLPATALLYLSMGMFRANALPDWGDMSQFENPPPRPPSDVLGWQPGWMVNDETPRLDPAADLVAQFPALAPFEPAARLVFFWIGNFGFLLVAALLIVVALLRRISGRKISWGWLALGLLACIVITPLLGKWPAYQKETFGKLLLGIEKATIGKCVALAAVAFFAAGAGWLLHARKARDFGLRWVLGGFAVLFLLEAVTGAASIYFPRAPLLRANAIPLVAVTLGFFWLLARIVRRREAGDWPAILFFSGLYLFFLCCQVKFAPWAWDNTKLMLWALLLMLPAFWDLLIVRWPPIVRGVALVALFGSGFIILLGGLYDQRHSRAIAQRSTLDGVEMATRDFPITEAFAGAPTYNHPLLLIGRKMVLGYPEHVRSHGLNCDAQLGQLHSLLDGANDWRISAARLNTRYLFYGPIEEQLFPKSKGRWRDLAQPMTEGDWGTLYDLETPPLPVAPE
jgi:hypothetical protein